MKLVIVHVDSPKKQLLPDEANELRAAKADVEMLRQQLRDADVELTHAKESVIELKKSAEADTTQEMLAWADVEMLVAQVKTLKQQLQGADAELKGVKNSAKADVETLKNAKDANDAEIEALKDALNEVQKEALNARDEIEPLKDALKEAQGGRIRR